MLIHDSTRETISSVSSNDVDKLISCLEVISSKNVFQSLLDKVLRTAAFQVMVSPSLSYTRFGPLMAVTETKHHQSHFECHGKIYDIVLVRKVDVTLADKIESTMKFILSLLVNMDRKSI